MEQNLLKDDKNKNYVCFTHNAIELTHIKKNRYINICFSYYLNLFLSFLGGYNEN